MTTVREGARGRTAGPRSRILALAVALGLLLTGCTATASPDASASGPRLREGQVGATPAASFQYGAFAVTVGYAVFDKPSKSLYVATRWRNLGDSFATAASGTQFAQLQPRSGAPRVIGQPSDGAEVAVPPRASAEITFAWSSVVGNPIPHGVLLFGDEGKQITTVSLRDGRGSGHTGARRIVVDRWANLGAHTVHVRDGLVSAGHLSDNTQAPRGSRVLRLTLDVWNSTASRVGWVASDYLALRRPDGRVVKSRPTPSERETVWSAIDGSWAEFEIPQKAAGDYELLLFRRAPGVFGVPIVGNSAVPIPIVIRPASIAPESRPADAALPVPRVPARSTGGASSSVPSGKDSTITVRSPAVNAAGCDIQLLRGAYSASSGQVELRLKVTPDGEQDGTSSPNSLFLPAALEVGGKMAGAQFSVNGMQPGVTQEVALTFSRIPAGLDLRKATLYLGRSARISLAGRSSPRVPVTHRFSTKPAWAGEFTIDLESYRVGYFSGQDPAPGMVELELDYTVSTNSDKSRHTTFFNPTEQVLLARPDHYVTPASSRDLTGILQLEVGQPKQVRTLFLVSRASLKAGKIYVLLRSRDETDFPTPGGWLETTIPAKLG